MKKRQAEERHLPILHGRVAESSLGTDGKRHMVYPADVSGKFATARKLAFFALIGLWVALPLVKIRGNPAVFLDMDRRQFFLFGSTFNAQDTWLLFFLLTGGGFGLIVLTAVLGRVWCGWACPQTVFLEGIFRPLERLIGGPRDARMRRAAGPWTPDRVFRTIATQLAYIVAALFVAHVFLGYFVSVPGLWKIVRGRPDAHPEAFAWMLAVTGIFYFNFAWFREQFCVVLCPYGRLQSALLDEHSIVVGYDEKRGEPRGKVGATTGDCIDCRRCVVVCPTGIDIRNGLQLDCIGCTACIDACDEIMLKVGRKKGLIRYDSLTGLAGGVKRILRPRIYVYAVFLLVGLGVATFTIRKREDYEANLLRLSGAPFSREGQKVRNAFEVHLVNKTNATQTYSFEMRAPAKASFVTSSPMVTLGPLESRRVSMFVEVNQSDLASASRVQISVLPANAKEPKLLEAAFIGVGK